MPSGTILVINCGSSSIKFALVDPQQPTFPLNGLAERLGSPEAALHWQQDGQKHSVAIAGADHLAALAQLLPLVQTVAGAQLAGIGHRVVHGGEHFSAASRIDALTVAAIRATAPLAPLHNPANLQGIDAALALFPDLPQVAVFDTAFHQDLPEHAYRYALPETLYREHGVRRYGFHGTSHRYVSMRAAEMAGLPVADSCWLSAHLGNGSSTCAIVNGRSRDTSMGLTPLEGLVMGTRSGDVDPNLFGHLSRTLGWSLEQTEHMLNHDSGLLGLSGLSNDMRSLEQAHAEGHPGATLAIEVFCYRLAKSLAAMGCALPQLDGLIFTGGIGENSALVRSKTVGHLKLLNLRLDPAANAACVRGASGPIGESGHPRVLVVPTNEERQIALDTLAEIAPPTPQNQG
ncbi:MAG: acetate kinase [Burkholderiaceae bacterium]|nr:acetate kinase [Burkholderiaceae bacterium]